MATIDISDNSFDNDVLNASGPVLVDFWAEWCGPCKMIGPALSELSDEMAGQVTIAKLNIDDNQESAAKYGIRSIPAMLIFKDGAVVAEDVGAKPKNQIKQWIEQNI